MSSLIHRVAQQHFQTTLRRCNQPHTFTLHIVFLRPVTAGDVDLKVQDTKLGSEISTIHVVLVQGGKEKMAAYASYVGCYLLSKPSHHSIVLTLSVSSSNVNMHNDKGISSTFGYEMTPKPIVADLDALSHRDDARWVGFVFPGHPQSLLKASSHVRMFVPTAGPPRLNLTDVWLTPSSPHTSFTTEILGYVADCWHRIPENNLPYATWDHATIVSAAARQRAQGRLADTEISGRDPPTYLYPTLTLSLEIKKVLPPEGVRWLFVRAQVKEVKHGRMDAEVMICDHRMGLVALSHQTCLVVENTQALKQKQQSTKGKL